MDKIRMLVGQEGPAISRARLQELTIGVDIDADEAQRLVDADFAEEVKGPVTPAGSAPAPATPAVEASAPAAPAPAAPAAEASPPAARAKRKPKAQG